jgi:ABC-type multidrug transport system fused ATPase/permease subunit
MIALAEKSLSLRAKLYDCHEQVTSLARDAGLTFSPQWDVTELRHLLDKPYLFSVWGEVNAGKSSLINALNGHYLCRVSELPQTDSLTLHRWGPQKSEPQGQEAPRIAEAPRECLRHIHWLDTPGLETRNRAEQQLWQSHWHASDVLLIVLAFRNPWAVATWDFLARLPQDCLAKSALVLQQCDGAPANDLAVMLQHIRDLAAKRLGSVPQVFAVSARQAFLAKTGQGDAASLHASGVPALEQWLTACIHGSPARQQAMDDFRRAILGGLFEMDEALDSIKRSVQEDVRFFDVIQQEIDDLQQTTLQRQTQGLGAIGEVFSREAKTLARLLRKRLGVLRSGLRVMIGDNTAQQLETTLQERLTAAVRDAAAVEMTQRIAACESHWQIMRQRVNEQTGMSAAAWPEIATRLEESGADFVDRMGTATKQAVSQLRLRMNLDHAIRERNGSLAVWMGMGGVVWSIAGIVGAFAIPWLPQIASVIASLLWLLAILFSIRSARTIVGEYRNRLNLSADLYFTALRSEYQEGLRLFFRQYSIGLEGVKQSVSQRSASAHTWAQRWRECFLVIKTIEQEMSE